MGEKPQIVMTRYLIKRFFKKNQPSKYTERVVDAFSELKSCWDAHGFMSPKCLQLENDFDFQYEEAMKMKKGFEDMSLDRFVIGQLNYPAFHKHQKGRYKDLMTGKKPYADSMYDGVVIDSEKKRK